MGRNTPLTITSGTVKSRLCGTSCPLLAHGPSPEFPRVSLRVFHAISRLYFPPSAGATRSWVCRWKSASPPPNSDTSNAASGHWTESFKPNFGCLPSRHHTLSGPTPSSSTASPRFRRLDLSLFLVSSLNRLFNGTIWSGDNARWALPDAGVVIPRFRRHEGMLVQRCIYAHQALSSPRLEREDQVMEIQLPFHHLRPSSKRVTTST